MKSETKYYNVYAVVNGEPIKKVNARRMSRESAWSKLDKLAASGVTRAYAILDGGKQC